MTVRSKRPVMTRIRVACTGLAVFLFLGLRPGAQAQSPTTPTVAQLHRGDEFRGDVRQLPSGLPKQHDRHPDRGEEPPLPSRGGFGDPALQTSTPAAPAPAPGSGGGAGNFAGLDFANNGDGWPPDPDGDVGPTYFIQTVNTSVGIFNKSDGSLAGAFTFDALMSQGHFGNACDGNNFGDGVVSWDSAMDRWVITDFAFALNASGSPVAPYYQCFAVSRSGDPVSGGWYFYSLETTDLFPDYPKLGVWPDAFYLTANMFQGNNFKNVRVWALNKAQMYAGGAVSVVSFNLPASIQGSSVFTGIPSTYHVVTGVPPTGRPSFVTVVWSAKVARVWQFHVDWTNTANSRLTGPSNVSLATWGVAPSTVPAKNGNGLDTLHERLMVQNQYTNISGAESLWLTHTVANPGNSTLTAPRWYQLNVTGGTVVTSGPVQQSTWAPDATAARWMPSLAVDKNGDMALGYSVASSTLFPALRYAGRLASDPPSTLGQTEMSLIEGAASQCCNFSDGTTNIRWGDYSAMTIDPDGCTFWYTNEFYQSPQPTSLMSDNWQTRIGSFKYSTCGTTSSGTLQGTVTDSVTHQAISSATVTVGALSTSTDANGAYTLSNVTAGSYTAGASAAGYTPGSASVTILAGVTTTQSFALVASGPASTVLNVAAASGTYGGTATLSATLTSAGTPVSGKTVSFSLNGAPAGSVSTDGSGVASVSNATLSGISPGTYATGVSATFAGDATYAMSSGANSLAIAKANQTITFNPLPDKTTSDPPFAVSATASSGLTVTFSASGGCTVSGSTVTITAVGTCTITASQAGNGNFNAAPNVPQTFNITNATSGTSPDGTTVPSATQIIDNLGAVWTIGANQAILRNGVQAAGGLGSEILWKNSTIYVLGTDSNWYQWTGSGWAFIGPVQPGGTGGTGGPPSPDGATVPPATQIVDNLGGVWTIGTNQAILRNGVQAVGGMGSEILWKSSTIYVLGTDSNWYQWTGSGWAFIGPVQPGGTGGTPSPDGTTVPPATQIVDTAGAVWTIGANATILRNGAQANGGLGSEILWKSSTIYVLGTDNNWYQWSGSGWVFLGSIHP